VCVVKTLVRLTRDRRVGRHAHRRAHALDCQNAECPSFMWNTPTPSAASAHAADAESSPGGWRRSPE
jgi:hypothetical protein